MAAPETAFATSVDRLFRDCVRDCAQTNGMAVEFVQAGQLHLQLFFSQAKQLFQIHERWLSVDSATTELGLADNVAEADILFHTVKRLFAEALNQLPCDLFSQDNVRTVEYQRKLEISLADQRLLRNHSRMRNLDIDMVANKLRLRWTVESRWDLDTEVEVQCHRASRCSCLRDNLLVAEDGANL